MSKYRRDEMDPNLKIYIASRSWYGGHGAYEDHEFVIIAESENVALGLALEAVEHSRASEWSFEEVEKCVGATYVSSASS
jgi:hypothetical protein